MTSTFPPLAARLLLLAPLLGACATTEVAEEEPLAPGTMQVRYLEFVTPEVEATITALSASHGVEFGEPVEVFGGARIAELAGGGQVGVRAPMHAQEVPVVRPYVLVDDIQTALAAAVAAGGVIAHPPLEIPGHGTFAIYFLGEGQHGLWMD